MERRHMYVLVGLVMAVGAIVLWFALGGFQLPGYGGMTAEQDAAAARATRIAAPVFVAGAVVAAIGLNGMLRGGRDRPARMPGRDQRAVGDPTHR